MQTDIKKTFISLFFSFILASIILSFTNFQSSSNDSKYYTFQVERYHNSKITELITPKWGENFYGFEPNSYMYDQFPGQLWIGVLGTKIFLPPKHSLHIIEMFFQMLSLFVLYFIIEHFNQNKKHQYIFIPLLFFPLAFSYNIRANHESGIALFAFLSILAGLKINKSKWWIVVTALSTLLLIMIKGPFVIFAFAYFSIGLILNKDKLNYLNILLSYVISALLCILFLYFFENAFYQLTGTSFLNEFYKIQFKTRAIELVDKHPFIIQKLLNFWYYINHCIQYSVPWFLITIYILIKKKFKNLNYIFSRESMALILPCLFLCALFSMSNRVAGRYAHPAYYLFNLWIFLVGYYNSITLQQFYQNKLSPHIIKIATFLWFFAFAIHFIPF